MKQEGMARFIYHLTMMRSRKMIREEFGKDFYQQFKERSDLKFHELMNEFEDIGESMFAFNYIYAPSYVAWYTSMEKLGLDHHTCDVWMLKMNEKMLLTVPKPFLHAIGKIYYRNMSKQAAKRQETSCKKLHPFDWNIEYRKMDDNNFEIDIKSCGFITYTNKYGGQGMLPGICQVDYMISHYMHVGFDRTQTLGAGGTLCDCRYCFNGSCDFDIEKRLKEKR